MSVSEDEYDEACAETLRMMHVRAVKRHQEKDLQVVYIVEDFNLGFNSGNSVKYIEREE